MKSFRKFLPRSYSSGPRERFPLRGFPVLAFRAGQGTCMRSLSGVARAATRFVTGPHVVDDAFDAGFCWSWRPLLQPSWGGASPAPLLLPPHPVLTSKISACPRINANMQLNSTGRGTHHRARAVALLLVCTRPTAGWRLLLSWASTITDHGGREPAGRTGDNIVFT